MEKHSNVVIILLTVGLVFVTIVLIHNFFTLEPDALVVELLAATVAVVLVIVSVGVTVHYQSIREIEKEFKVELFRSKIQQYQKYILAVVECDDINHDHSSDEKNQAINTSIENVQNITREISLIASEPLIKELSVYLEKIIKHKKIYFPEHGEGTFRHVLIEMRKDLNVDKNRNEEEVAAHIRNMMDKGVTIK